ncbi:MAG TPA: hypothetical protein ENF75_00970 [Acidilobales archaeon]|nr:MAG: hypothetical protein B6U85_06540 [Desulfurococcales archaeon ex4484_42]HDD25646.1 hypothetical protein [Acidilobales archaeon]
MIAVSLEKKYLINKGSNKFLVELYKDSKGRMYAVISRNLIHVIEKEEGKLEEWEHDTKDAEEVNYMDLPANIRKVISTIL